MSGFSADYEFYLSWVFDNGGEEMKKCLSILVYALAGLKKGSCTLEAFTSATITVDSYYIRISCSRDPGVSQTDLW